MGSNGASLDFVCDNNNAESSFSEKAAYSESTVVSEAEIHNGNEETREDKTDGGNGANVDELVDKSFDDKSFGGEKVVSDATVEDIGNKSTPNVISQECPDHCDASKDQSDLHDSTVADDIGMDIENKTVAADTELNNAVCKFQEGCTEPDASLGTELVGADKGISKEDDVHDQVFEPGSVLVEYGRPEACCNAAHTLHGRVFDGRMVTVEYVALSLYKARFTK